MKVGVVGAGRILSAYFEAAEHAGIEIAALCDVGDPVLPSRMEAVPLFSDFRDLAKLPDLDALIIAVPSSMHFEVAMMALDVRRPLLIEKPLTLTAEQFDQLRQTASARGMPVFSLLHAQYGAEVIATRKRLLDLKEASSAPISVNWSTTLCDPYGENPAAQKSLVNAWVDGGINAISIALAAMPGAELKRISGVHSPANHEWARVKSRQTFQVGGEWTGSLTIETDWSQRHGTKTSSAELPDGSKIELHHTNEAIRIIGDAPGTAQSFRNKRSRLANHYVEAFRDARKHIAQGRSNWEFSQACHTSYFSCFP